MSKKKTNSNFLNLLKRWKIRTQMKIVVNRLNVIVHILHLTNSNQNHLKGQSSVLCIAY